MRILYVGKFSSSDDEEHIAQSLENLGHEVIRLPMSMTEQEMHRKITLSRYDFILFAKWEPSQLIKEAIKNKNTKTVCWLFDLYWDYPRQYRLKSSWYFKADKVITTDGGEHPWSKIGINHSCVRQGIFDKECYIEEFNEPDGVVFVGSDNPFFPERSKLMNQLNIDYQFEWIGKHSSKEARGPVLNSIYAATKIVVGDSVYSPGYWSNRVVETLGRGGFLIHREVEGIKEEYPFLVTYNGKYDDLKSKIDYFMSHEEERRDIVIKNFNWVKEHYTYDKKCKELMDIICEELFATPQNKV